MYMKRSEVYFILKSYTVWLLILFAVIFFASKFVALQNNFIGGGMRNYLANPYLWVWANFDGEHYLSIAQNGYQPLTYFFFPVYPFLIKYLSLPFRHVLPILVKSGIILSMGSLLMGLLGFYMLARLDFNEFASKYAVILLLLFPTSFFFGSVYTESLFFALSVWSFYFARKGRWLDAGLLAAFATATRIIGLALFIALAIEAYSAYRKDGKLAIKLLGVTMSLTGILGYMVYLKQTTGDALNFLHTIGIFGAQRSSNFVILPQVIYRYVFKVLPSLNYNYFPGVFSGWLEFGLAILFLFIAIFSIVRLRPSYSSYLILGYLIPTLSGSFSSMPRYLLVLFPAFLFVVGSFYKNKRFLFVFSIASSILLVVSFALFARGYWIS